MTDEKPPLQFDVNVTIHGTPDDERDPGAYEIYEYRVINNPHMIFEATIINADEGLLKLDVTIDGPASPESLQSWFKTTIKAIAEKL